MLYLRIFLLSGLLLHKLVWEVLKRDIQTPLPASKPPVSPRKRLVKGIKAAVLVFLLVQTAFLDILPIAEQSAGIRAAGIAFFVAGLATAIVGRLQLGENWANLEDYQVLPEQNLVRRGIYRYVRHPIYAGDILLVLGLQLALNSWLVVIVLPLIAVVVKQTQAEEQLLVRTFPEYGAYCKETKMFIPYLV